MKVGIISPIEFLDKYCVTDVQYCLPNLLCENERYRNFYIKKEREGNIIILDCKKPTWKREPASFRTIELALSLIKPSIIVAPSYLYNLKESQKIFLEFKKEFSNLFHKTIRCIEGTSEKEVERYLKDRKTLAIPSHMYRYTLKKDWSPNTIYIENHLNLEELDGRDGILVTSLPIKLGFQGRLLSDYLPSPPSLTFFEEEDRYPQITSKNVEEAIEHYKS